MRGILACTLETWRPVIGDPGWQGWTTVAVYAATALLALALARAAPFPRASRGRERAFWGLVAVLMAALAVNKQLDLQSALTAAGRCTALAQGWYEGRRPVQAAFLIAIAGLGLVLLAVLLAVLRGTWARSALPVAGLVFVTGFVMMRAVGFHGFDAMLGLPVPGTVPGTVLGLRANTLLEWTGPVLIAATALVLLRRRRGGP
ncbi:MAG TPA: isopropylmalate isomerase [Paracoccaceae bacterium]|nr:isopropylmalate isomerase [Paracoccaceae bacterium]HMO70053.1 isopropylmalate isomerase [Paracoccaceae bacterium]